MSGYEPKMRRLSKVCFTESKPCAFRSSPVDRGKRWYSNFLPVKGSLSLFWSSKEEEPVTNNCTSGKLSVIRFNVIPIFSTLCASSMTSILFCPISNFNSCVFIAVSISCTSGSSQFRRKTGSLRPSNTILKSVLLPTCLAPITTIALPANIRDSITSCNCRRIISLFTLDLLQR